VTGQINGDDVAAGRQHGKQRPPGLGAAAESVEQEERGAVAGLFDAISNAPEVDGPRGHPAH